MTATIKPIPLLHTLLIFGLPGIAIFTAVNYLVPHMLEHGFTLVFAWTLSVVGPTVLNAVVVISLYCLKERPTFAVFLKRFRLTRPDKRIIWLVPLVAVAALIINESQAWTIPYINTIPGFAVPEVVPEIFANSYEVVNNASVNATFMGVTLNSEAWWLIPYWIFFWLLLAVFGEELVWRGYILPAHEQQYGKYAWLLNGLLWNIPFHLYTNYNLFADLGLYMLLPFMVQRVGNTWFGIAMHVFLVSLAFVIIIPGVV